MTRQLSMRAAVAFAVILAMCVCGTNAEAAAYTISQINATSPWLVNGAAPTDLSLHYGIPYLFTVEGAAIPIFYIATETSNLTCAPSVNPCTITVTFNPPKSQFQAQFGTDAYTADGHRAISLSWNCTAFAASAQSCGDHAGYCEWCQRTLRCNTMGSQCDTCGSIVMPSQLCGAAVVAPGCTFCVSTMTCTDSTANTCPHCNSTGFVATVHNTTGCGVANGQITVASSCASCTASVTPQVGTTTKLPSVGWTFRNMTSGTYTITVALTGCSTTAQVTIPDPCTPSSSSSKPKKGVVIEWWAWVILAAGIVVVIAAVALAVVLVRHTKILKKNEAMFAKDDDVHGDTSGHVITLEHRDSL